MGHFVPDSQSDTGKAAGQRPQAGGRGSSAMVSAITVDDGLVQLLGERSREMKRPQLWKCWREGPHGAVIALGGPSPDSRLHCPQPFWHQKVALAPDDGARQTAGHSLKSTS